MFTKSNKTLESKICKTYDEATNSKVFFERFSICIKKMKNLEDREVYNNIINKLNVWKESISYNEYKYLENLLKNKEFIEIAENVLNKSINFSGKKEEYDTLLNLNISNLKIYLLDNIYTTLINNTTSDINSILNKGKETIKPIFENNSIEIYKQDDLDNNIRGLYFIRYKQDGLIREFESISIHERNLVIIAKTQKDGYFLLNDEGKELSGGGNVFKSLKVINDKIILAELGIQSINPTFKILNNNGDKVSKKSYNGIIELGNGLIFGLKANEKAQASDKIGLLLNRKGKEISDIYYNMKDGIYNNTNGLIKIYNQTNGYWTLIDEDGNEVNIIKKMKNSIKGFFEKQ